MPLPNSSPIVLHASQATPALGGKAKRAMIFKLSDEALDALLSHHAANSSESAMHVEFGKSPGIHIGKKFFPSTVLRDESHHELLIRADKPDAPLRHHAMVEGKLQLVRQLDSKVGDKVRARGEELTGLSKAKPIQILDAPPPIAGSKSNGRSNPKKVSSSSSLMKQVVKSEAKLKAAVPSRPASPFPVDHNDPVRKELIHHLAVKQPIPKKDVLDALGRGLEATKIRLAELLPQVASEDPPVKRVGSTPPVRNWRLNPEAWLEVRPYEHPDLTDPQRKSMAIMARTMLSNLKIPESDPRWDHVKLKSSSTTTNGASNGSSNGAIKSSTKLKPPPLTKTGRVTPDLETPKSTPPKRPLPGSKFSGTNDPRSSASPLPSPSFPAASSKPGSSQLKPSGAKGRGRDTSPTLNRKPSPSSRPDLSPDLRREASLNRLGEGSAPKRKRDDESPSKDGGISKISKRHEDVDASEHRKRDSLSIPTAKGHGHKRTESTASTTSLGGASREDLSTSKRPRPSVADSKTLSDRRDSAARSSRKRTAPEYTSSEDEDDVPLSSKKHHSGGSAAPQVPKPSKKRPTNGYLPPNIKIGGPLPTDRTSLRKRYEALYPAYMNLYHKSVAQRAVIQAALDKASEEGEVDEEEPDEEMLSASDLERLTTDLEKVEKELNRITRASG